MRGGGCKPICSAPSFPLSPFSGLCKTLFSFLENFFVIRNMHADVAPSSPASTDPRLAGFPPVALFTFPDPEVRVTVASDSFPESDSESYFGSDTFYVPDRGHVSSVTCPKALCFVDLSELDRLLTVLKYKKLHICSCT